jgi:hypothetical protein
MPILARVLAGVGLTLIIGASPLAAADKLPPDFQPDPASVQRYGPAYRYPQAGWIVLHVEGEPYDRGFQQGKLIAEEIAGHVRCFATMRSPKAPVDGWNHTRTLVKAVFLRRFDKEYLDEMKGIADGAAEAGAKFDNRPLDVTDIAAINLWPEIDTLDGALQATPTGLEGRKFEVARPEAVPKQDHCSAFAATGPATADGKIVFGHITMFALYPANFYNLWLDIKPAKGHRIMMQSYPGGIQSGMDHYMNDAGLLVCETTISQTKFDVKGETVASRIRRALQYADNIDKAVEILKESNNGLYTNEWLLADTKTNEIAMFELGTEKSKLWRSSKNEWFGGTEGFYWGCNNTKDVETRLETLPSTSDRPGNVIFRPRDRDKMWIKLYEEHKGKIDADFGKLAFTTAPIAAFPSFDAKFTTTAMAKEMKTWALFGPPLGKSWQPKFEERELFPEIRALASNPWTVLHPRAPAEPAKGAVVAVDLEGPKDGPAMWDEPPIHTKPAWHGTLLPKADADVWLAAAFADYERIVSLEQAILKRRAERTKDEKPDSRKDEKADDDLLPVRVALYGYRSEYLAAARVAGDQPLSKIKSDVSRDEWYRMAVGKGVLVLDELRQRLGNDEFAAMMDEFGRAHAGKQVTTAEFVQHVTKLPGKKLGGFFETWLDKPGLMSKGGTFTTQSFHAELDQALIVYGTADEVASNREAAEELQKSIIRHWNNVTVPIKADKDVSDDELKKHHLVLIGRPDSNRVVARVKESLPIQFGPKSFVLNGETYAHMTSAVIVAGENPMEPRYSVVAIAGLSADATLRAAPLLVQARSAEAVLYAHGKPPRSLVLK